MQTRRAPQLPRLWRSGLLAAMQGEKESGLMIRTAMQAVVHLLPDAVEAAPVVDGIADQAMGAMVGGLAVRRSLPTVSLPGAS